MKAAFALLAVAATFAVAVAPALATNAPHGMTFITNTLGGNGHSSKAAVHRYRFITDTLGGSGGAATATGCCAVGQPGRSPQGPAPLTLQNGYATGAGQSSATTSNVSFNWSDAGVGAATATGTILALFGALLLVARRRSTLAI